MPRSHIRLLKSYEDFLACERIQKAVWGTLAASTELLSVTQKYGGVVLGAVVEGKIVGFLYAFLARRRGRLAHWSHMMAVEVPYRDLGLGFRMKLRHRRLALAQGLRCVSWTYDPLQSRNAFLNVGRLGGRVSEYVPDCYGHFQSRIEKGLPSDRFVVDWRISSAAVERRLREGVRHPANLTAPRINTTCFDARGFLGNRSIALGLDHPQLLVEIPPNTDAMRAKALEVAQRWRTETRRIFEHYFAAGYQVEDFMPPGRATEGHCYYVLRRHKDRNRQRKSQRRDT
jgi:predicted GNAT superfamily acetyltransferase